MRKGYKPVDALFQVVVLNQTPDPERVIYQAMHQDYSPSFVTAEERIPEQYGEAVVKHLLEGNRGHYGPLEHPQITFGVGYFPHTVMQQARTHRVGISFDVQCLAGDTEITFVKSSGEIRKIKIAELYDLWKNGEKGERKRKIRGRCGEPPEIYRRDCKTRLRKMRLRVLDEETRTFEIGHIHEVMYSGEQPVYRLTLADGKALDCTANHRIYTTKGWQRMGEAVGLITDNNHQVLALTKECEVLVNGVLRPDALYSQETWLATQADQGLTAVEIAQQCECSADVIRYWARQFGIKLASGRRRGAKHLVGNGLYRDKAWLQTRLEQGLHVDQIATLADCSIETVKSWVYRYRLTLNRRSPGTDKPWNKGLIVEPKQWALKPKPPSRKLKAHPVKVVAVKYLGIQTTYDLEVQGPWHNFVANGIVVHNSFRYTGQQIAELGKSLLYGQADPPHVSELEDKDYVLPARADLETLFYLPETVKEGKAKTRQGFKPISPEALDIILEQYRNQAIAYYRLVEECGLPYEDARNIIGYGIRQHFVVSFNCRSLMHFLDLRAKEDAQREIQQLCELLWPHFEAWCPHVAAWYHKNRWGKARLSP